MGDIAIKNDSEFPLFYTLSSYSLRYFLGPTLLAIGEFFSIPWDKPTEDLYLMLGNHEGQVSKQLKSNEVSATILDQYQVLFLERAEDMSTIQTNLTFKNLYD